MESVMSGSSPADVRFFVAPELLLVLLLLKSTNHTDCLVVDGAITYSVCDRVEDTVLYNGPNFCDGALSKKYHPTIFLSKDEHTSAKASG